MSLPKILDELELAVANIHKSQGIENATVVKEVSSAVSGVIVPFSEKIAELQKAAQDTLAALESGDIEAAKAFAGSVAHCKATTDEPAKDAANGTEESAGETSNNGGEQAVS